MSMFSRSLALLQQAEVILTQDLAGVDLHALRKDTLRDSDMSDATAQVWTDVLLAVSPTLFDLSRELLRVHRYMELRQKSLKSMQNIIWTLEAILIVFIVLSVGHVLQGNDKRDKSGSAVSVGMIVALGFFMFGALGSWLAVINDMYRKLRFQVNSPLHSVLLRFSDRTANTFIVMFVAAATTGRDVRQSVAAYMKDREKRDNVAAQWSNCKKGTVAAPVSCEFSGMNGCSLQPFYTTPELTSKIRVNCKSTLVDIADALIDLADNGSSRYVRMDLWTTIDAGVQAVRQLVLTRYDDVDLQDGQPTYTPDVISTIARDELAPCLMLPGIQLNRAFGGLSSSQVESSGLAMMSKDSIDASRMNGPDGESLCFRSCMDSPDCKVAYFFAGDGGKTVQPGCYIGADYSSLGPNGVLQFKGVGQGNASLYVAKGVESSELTLCGPGAQKVFPGGRKVSSSSNNNSSSNNSNNNSNNNSKTCLAGTAPGLYSSAAVAASLSSTMLDQLTFIANRVLVVLRRHRFALSIDDLRPDLDQVLSEYYGDSTYESAMSPAVDAVLKRADDLSRYERRNPRATIDSERLLQKLMAMPSQDAGDLQRVVEELKNTAVQHRNVFPAFRGVATNRIATNVLVLGSLTVIMMFAVYAYILYVMYSRPKSLGGPAIKLDKMIQRMIVGLCVLVLVLFVVQTIATKVTAKSNHNVDVIDQNGETLVGTSESVARTLAQLWILLGRSATVQSHVLTEHEVQLAQASTPAAKRAASASLLSQAALLITTYDKCNSVTTGQVSTPPPYSELLMYAVVAGLFIVATFVSVYHIAPGKKLDNVKALNKLITRVKKGDVSAIKEAETAVQCARPPAFVWSIFVWYGVMLLVVVTVWFVMESQNATNDYEDSLAMRTDCV